MNIDPLFDTTTTLSALGISKMEEVRKSFSQLLWELRATVPVMGREWALVQTKLEEASFHAVKSLKNHPANVKSLKNHPANIKE